MKQPIQSPEGRARCPKRAEEGSRLAGRSQGHDAHVHFGFRRSDFGTRIVLCLIFVLPIAGAALAQPTPIVVLNGLANVEGNSSATEPFNSSSFRFQQVFDASQFGGLPTGSGMSNSINSIFFRLDGASTEDALLYFGGASVQLSTTQRGPDGLSPMFAENRGSDAVTVWNGPIAFAGDPPTAPGMPAPFNLTILLASPFFYNPLQGNLLLEVAGVDGQAFFPGALDGHAATEDSISWVFAMSNLAPSGSIDTFGLVTRFDITIIPEPAIWQILLTGLLALVVALRRWRCTSGTNHQDISN